jgi:RNA polymerase-binding transcription factor DksA
MQSERGGTRSPSAFWLRDGRQFWQGMRMNRQDATRRTSAFRLFSIMKSKATTKPRKAPAKVAAKTARRSPGRTKALPAGIVQPKAPAIEPTWRWHYRTLVALRDRLLRQSENTRREAAEPIEAHSTHAADSATDEFEHDVALTLLARGENSLREVNDASTRILEGRYGICEATGEKIPASRLRALPWCRYSREAEEALERHGGDTKLRVPQTISLRGWKNNLPGTGTMTRENSEGPADEPQGRDEARNVADPSQANAGESETERGE